MNSTCIASEHEVRLLTKQFKAGCTANLLAVVYAYTGCASESQTTHVLHVR